MSLVVKLETWGLPTTMLAIMRVGSILSKDHSKWINVSLRKLFLQ